MSDFNLSTGTLTARAADIRLHFQGLDFLRGVAAICVVMFHISSRLNLLGLFNHGYLAVDFFFILSGFIVARAYGGRLRSGELSFKSFVLIRLIRLSPMVVFGTIVAGFVDLFRTGDFTFTHHLSDIYVAAVMSCLYLPLFWPTTLEQTTFPLNGPVWSLFFELFANFAFVPVIRLRRSKQLFWSAALVSLGILVFASRRNGDVQFGTHTGTFLLGFPRVIWSYSVGILLADANLRLPSLNKWFYAVAVTLVFMCPGLSNGLNAWFDVVAVGLVLPAIVLGAANCKAARRFSTISKMSADASYPLYAVHYPFVRAVGVVGRYFGSNSVTNFLLATTATAFFLWVSSVIFTVYDQPVRRRLSRWMMPLLTKPMATHQKLRLHGEILNTVS
jgi:peptidoglycan/LPS O-acetylase OafA/YrhL